MKSSIRTIAATLLLTLTTIGFTFAQTSDFETAAPMQPRALIPGMPAEAQQFFRSLQYGAIAQIAAVVILIVGLILVLSRLRRIELAIQKLNDKR